MKLPSGVIIVCRWEIPWTMVLVLLLLDAVTGTDVGFFRTRYFGWGR